jgi:heat shock protein HslJ
MSTDGSTRVAAGSKRIAIAAVAALLATACAATPAPLTDLADTNWRVALVNGRPTPADGDYSMKFEGPQVDIRLGCNHMGGRYAIRGDVLTVSDLAQTAMACPAPANSFEQEGSVVLSRPMRMALTSNDRLGLSNEAGSIALDPVP